MVSFAAIGLEKKTIEPYQDKGCIWLVFQDKREKLKSDTNVLVGETQTCNSFRVNCHHFKSKHEAQGNMSPLSRNIDLFYLTKKSNAT